MKHLLKSLLALLLIIPAIAIAANAPPRLQVLEKITIKADAAKVWETVKQFDQLHSWHPAVTASEASGNAVGATRTLTLGNGGTIVEELKTLKEDKMMLKYRIKEMSSTGSIDDHGKAHDIPVVPVNKYIAFITVKAVEGGAEVSWKGKFFRAYTGHHEVPQELGDEIAKTTITGFYKAGLENLKTMLEK